MEEETFRRFNTEPLEDLWEPQRELNHLADSPDLIVEASDVLIRGRLTHTRLSVHVGHD
jgi:hypothetical protein